MIQTQSILRVADNSGAKTVRCIKIMSREGKRAGLGDYIIVSVKSLRLRRKSSTGSSKSGIRKGQIFKALIIRTKKGVCGRKHGHHLSFQTNDVILINNQDNLLGSRISGPITRELRAMPLGKKIISQSKRML